ncbi:MAG: hypothetical protein GF317_19885 [Candidatus Lokiarchaeota archaeon]|nr:hypothetical protein [Candidatus Lokiarchaeota archaeon]MBD3201754.1 hypothetical protein [Candidatus Lokiarchaeota archaeon]
MAKKKKSDSKKEKKEEPKKKDKVVYKKIKVDFWRTRLHDEELGVYQQMKYQAKTRWFSKNYDIEGLIEVDDKKEYIIAFNKEDWEETPEDEPKRLSLRYFTIMEEEMGVGSGGNFHGGIELSIAHSLVQSFEVQKPSPVFFMTLPRDVNLYRLVSGWRLLGTRWSWPLLPEKKGDMFQMVRAKGVIGPGRNYDIYLGEKKIARVDAQRVQKEYEIEIYDEDYAKDVTFQRMITLFACACNFMHDTEKIIKKLFKKMKKSGTTDYKIPKSELDLFRNPRMMRR